jgi:hypothetical protein
MGPVAAGGTAGAAWAWDLTEALRGMGKIHQKESVMKV